MSLRCACTLSQMASSTRGGALKRACSMSKAAARPGTGASKQRGAAKQVGAPAAKLAAPAAPNGKRSASEVAVPPPEASAALHSSGAPWPPLELAAWVLGGRSQAVRTDSAACMRQAASVRYVLCMHRKSSLQYACMQARRAAARRRQGSARQRRSRRRWWAALRGAWRAQSRAAGTRWPGACARRATSARSSSPRARSGALCAHAWPNAGDTIIDKIKKQTASLLGGIASSVRSLKMASVREIVQVVP
jgi:hypothetical protein